MPGGAANELANLQREVKSLSDDYPSLTPDDRFVVWFLSAYVTGDRDDAFRALTGRSGEKSLDAILIDDRARLVALVQAKYRKKLKQTAEKREDVISFARVAQVLTQSKDDFDEFIENLEPVAKAKFREARTRVVSRKYRLNLHYVTLGRCSRPLESEAKRLVRAVPVESAQRPRLTVLDGDAVLALFEEYLDGVAPPVPTLDLPVDGVAANQYDTDSKIESWIFPMNGRDMGNLLRQTGVRIFARNIRGYLGNVKINREIKETIKGQPQSFLYLNNGVTIVCDAAELERSGGAEVLNVSNPQIINGQQTTYALEESGAQAAKSRVFVRVIKVPRDKQDVHKWADYESMVQDIVEATNSQSTIKPADLRSNDRRQIELEREFHKRRYYYVRKRGIIAGPELAVQHVANLTKEEVAQAVMATEDASFTRARSVQALFEDPPYSRIFGHSPQYLLACWWLQRVIANQARGSGEQGYARSIAFQFIWEDQGAAIRQKADAFAAMCEQETDGFNDLQKAAKQLLRAGVRYYTAKRGTGEKRQEISGFFKRRDVFPGFETYLRSSQGTAGKRRYRAAIVKFALALKSSS